MTACGSCQDSRIVAVQLPRQTGIACCPVHYPPGHPRWQSIVTVPCPACTGTPIDVAELLAERHAAAPCEGAGKAWAT